MTRRATIFLDSPTCKLPKTLEASDSSRLLPNSRSKRAHGGGPVPRRLLSHCRAAHGVTVNTGSEWFLTSGSWLWGPPQPTVPGWLSPWGPKQGAVPQVASLFPAMPSRLSGLGGSPTAAPCIRANLHLLPPLTSKPGTDPRIPL